jgi:hypothetical protein
MHQGIAPAVDAREFMVLGSGEHLGVLPQQHRLVDFVAMGCRDSDNVINPGGGMQLVAQGPIPGHARHEGLDRRKRHDGVNNQAHL